MYIPTKNEIKVSAVIATSWKCPLGYVSNGSQTIKNLEGVPLTVGLCGWTGGGTPYDSQAGDYVRTNTNPTEAIEGSAVEGSIQYKFADGTVVEGLIVSLTPATLQNLNETILLGGAPVVTSGGKVVAVQGDTTTTTVADTEGNVTVTITKS